MGFDEKSTYDRIKDIGGGYMWYGQEGKDEESTYYRTNDLNRGCLWYVREGGVSVGTYDMGVDSHLTRHIDMFEEEGCQEGTYGIRVKEGVTWQDMIRRLQYIQNLATHMHF